MAAKFLGRLGWLLAVLLHVARSHVVGRKFMDVELFHGSSVVRGPVGAGKLDGLFLVQFIDLEIPL